MNSSQHQTTKTSEIFRHDADNFPVKRIGYLQLLGCIRSGLLARLLKESSRGLTKMNLSSYFHCFSKESSRGLTKMNLFHCFFHMFMYVMHPREANLLKNGQCFMINISSNWMSSRIQICFFQMTSTWETWPQPNGVNFHGHLLGTLISGTNHPLVPNSSHGKHTHHGH